MARTLWGNILETLAGAGINTAAKIGANYLMLPMQAEKEAQQQVLRSLIPTMATESDPNKLSAIASRIKDISGVDLNLGVGTNPAGTEVTGPGGAKLTAPAGMDLSTLAPELKPTPSFIKPTPSLESMKVGLAQTLTPEEQKTAFFPKDATLQAAYLNAEANRQLRQSEGAANRASREQIAQGNQDTRAMIAQQAQQSREDWRNFLKVHMQDKLDQSIAKGEQSAQQRELSQFIGLQNQISLATGDQKKALQTQANKMIEATNNPILKSFPVYTEDVSVPGTGYNLPLVGEVGTKKQKVPVGTAQTGATTQDIPSAADIASYKRAIQLNANNPEVLQRIQNKAKTKFPKYNWGQ